MMSKGPSTTPSQSLRSWLGSAQDDNLSFVLELLATGHWKLGTDLWHIKKDKALHEMGAIRTRSGLALRLSADNWCRAARSSSASAARG